MTRKSRKQIEAEEAHGRRLAEIALQPCPPPEPTTLGRLVRHMRRDKMTMGALANATDTTAVFVSEVERDKRVPSDRWIHRAAEAMGVDARPLLDMARPLRGEALVTPRHAAETVERTLAAVANRLETAAGKAEREAEAHPDVERARYCEGQAHGLRAALEILKGEMST